MSEYKKWNTYKIYPVDADIPERLHNPAFICGLNAEDANKGFEKYIKEHYPHYTKKWTKATENDIFYFVGVIEMKKDQHHYFFIIIK